MEKSPTQIQDSAKGETLPLLFSPDPHTLSRRNFLRLSGELAGAAVLARAGLSFFPEGEGLADQRSLAFARVSMDLVAAQSSTDKQRIQDAEKVLYLWTYCNLLELGARSLGLSLAADNMRHYLYGDGSPKDLSLTFSKFLKNSYLKGEELQYVGIDYLAGKGVRETLVRNTSPQLYGGLVKSLASQNPDDRRGLVGNVEDIVAQTQVQPLVFDSYLGLKNERERQDWLMAVGGSLYTLSFAIDPSSRKSDVGVESWKLTSYQVSFTDKYDWDREDLALIKLPSNFITQFLYSLKFLPETKFTSTHEVITRLTAVEKKLFPYGANQKDLSLLAKKGYAKEFDMYGKAEDSNLQLPFYISGVMLGKNWLL